jgi:transcription-repair coupling factor (superfamily II helicase)
VSDALRALLAPWRPTLDEAWADGHLDITPRGVVPALALRASDQPIVVITDTTAAAERLRDDLAAWWDDVAVWPAWDIHPTERISPDITAVGERIELRVRIAAGQGPRIVVVPVRALTQVLPAHEPAARTVRRGEQIDRDELVAWFVRHGARREHLVEHRGEIAVRGDIVDIWSAHHVAPIRLDLFGDVVERLVEFDPNTQRTTAEFDTVVLAPSREWLLDETERANAETWATRARAVADVMHQLAEGAIFDGMEAWLSLVGTTTTLAELLAPSFEFVVLEPAAVASRATTLVDEERQLVDVLAATWGLTATVPLLHRSLADTLPPSVVGLRVASMPPSGEPVEVLAPPAALGDLGRLGTHVADVASAARVLVTVATPETAAHVADRLEADGLAVNRLPSLVADASVSVIASSLADGFVLSHPPLVVWGEQDVFARRTARRAPRARTVMVDGFMDDLTIGSFVVHAQHGIGKYVGSTRRTVAGTERDYLILEYKGGDRVYVPTERIDVLTPYTGGEEPTLSKMGGAEWRKTTAKAKAAALAVAEELVVLYRQRARAAGYAFGPDTPWQQEVESLFPYTETPDQARAINEVKADMEAARPMDRLVCADVGFGKTEIALRAIFKAVQDGKQAVLLAPTTLLASQHFATLSERFAGYPLTVRLLSRFVEGAAARATVAGLEDGSVDVVVGTHRLLQDTISFRRLGLLVVDEEQRFGVTHKEAIKKLSAGVDVLTLSASPIPRTLEMALSGLRDLSLVQTPPTARRPILTHVGEYDPAAVVEAIRRELLREGQVFFLHNRVADIDEIAEGVRQLVPEARVAVAHGQMDEGTLERVVQDFYERRSDVLVCTTIVESGIDMPNVNTLIVDRADRLGLGQLHQLRGRVGRGGARAYAYLFYPAHRELTETALERLRTIGEHTALGSGFKIAMRDLAIRGAGSLLGHDQSGHQIAAVGYDHYMALVADAVREARGTPPPPVPASTVTLDIPGAAYVPADYITSEGERLEAYRRLAGVTVRAGLDDLAAEWRDRYGVPPAPVQGLLDVVVLKLLCLARGVTTITVRDQGPTRSVVIAPLALTLTKQMYLERKYGENSYHTPSQTVRITTHSDEDLHTQLEALLEVLVPIEVANSPE